MPGSIINDAQLPDSASGPLGILAIASGLLLGLLFGLLLAFAIERADKRVRRSVDLEREFDVPVLVEVPTGARTDFSVVQSTHSRQGNAFSELRNVLVSLVSDREQIILVAGASDGPAGSIVAANLAVSLARMNLDTVLVCADPASSGRQILDLDPEAPGLSELLHGGLNVASLEQRPATGHGLRVIPPGVEAELTSEATQVFLTEQAIRQFRHSARFVVIDAPPMSSGSQAQTLARLAHVTVLVVELGTTTHDQVLRAARLIDLVGTRSIGMVAMPRVPVRREKRAAPAASAERATAATTDRRGGEPRLRPGPVRHLADGPVRRRPPLRPVRRGPVRPGPLRLRPVRRLRRGRAALPGRPVRRAGRGPVRRDRRRPRRRGRSRPAQRPGQRDHEDERQQPARQRHRGRRTIRPSRRRSTSRPAGSPGRRWTEPVSRAKSLRLLALPLGVALLAAGCGGGPAASLQPGDAAASAASTTAPAATAPAAASGPVAPLTGLPTSAAVAARPAIAVRVPLEGGIGLNDADLVYQEYERATLPQVLAIFQSKDAAEIGPVGGVRPADPALLPSLRPLYANTGGASGTEGLLEKAAITQVTSSAAASAYRSGTAGLMTSTAGVLAAAPRGAKAPPRGAAGGRHRRGVHDQPRRQGPDGHDHPARRAGRDVDLLGGRPELAAVGHAGRGGGQPHPAERAVQGGPVARPGPVRAECAGARSRQLLPRSPAARPRPAPGTSGRPRR